MEIIGLLMNMIHMHMLNALLDKKLIRANNILFCSQFKSILTILWSDYGITLCFVRFMDL